MVSGCVPELECPDDLKIWIFVDVSTEVRPESRNNTEMFTACFPREVEECHAHTVIHNAATL